MMLLSSAGIVERPVVVQEFGYQLARLQLGLHRRVVAQLPRIAREHVVESAETLMPFLEVLAEPLEDRAHLELARASAIASAVTEEAAHAVLQLLVEPLRGVGLGPERWAANARADDSRVNAWILVARAQLLVLDPVEAAWFTQQREEALLPRR